MAQYARLLFLFMLTLTLASPMAEARRKKKSVRNELMAMATEMQNDLKESPTRTRRVREPSGLRNGAIKKRKSGRPAFSDQEMSDFLNGGEDEQPVRRRAPRTKRRAEVSYDTYLSSNNDQLLNRNSAPDQTAFKDIQTRAPASVAATNAAPALTAPAVAPPSFESSAASGSSYAPAN